jgi:hypothetical protein
VNLCWMQAGSVDGDGDVGGNGRFGNVGRGWGRHYCIARMRGGEVAWEVAWVVSWQHDLVGLGSVSVNLCLMYVIRLT